MTWTACKIVLRLLTPLHVGAGQLGNVQRTRPYVTGKSLWGALTARLTRDYSDLGGNYGEVGQRVNEELAFSYFYPAVGETVDLWPWDETTDEFAWRYLGAYASTALDYGRSAAEEGSLHETEFIAPVTRDGQPVYLVGYIFERQGCALRWQEALPWLQLGGERTYGWGRVKPSLIMPADGSFFGLDATQLAGERPTLRLTSGSPLLAHAPAVGANAVAAEGRLMPLVGRETQAADRHGQCVAFLGIYWEPGSTVTADATFAIGPYGIWARGDA